jgi:hypothetical protein
MAVKILMGIPEVNPGAERNIAIISACDKGYTEIVIELLRDTRVDPSSREDTPLRRACDKGNYRLAKVLLADDRVRPWSVGNEAIREASRQGSALIVRELLKNKKVDPCARDNEPIMNAIANGHPEVIRELVSDRERINFNGLAYYQFTIVREFLIEGGPNYQKVFEACLESIKNTGDMQLRLCKEKTVDPSVFDNLALRSACAHGNVKLVQTLLSDPRVDPSSCEDEALIASCKSAMDTHDTMTADVRSNGLVYKTFIQIVDILLKDPRVDPSARNNTVMKNFISRGKDGMVMRFIDHPRLDLCANNNELLHLALWREDEVTLKAILKDPRMNIEDSRDLSFKLAKDSMERFGFTEKLLEKRKAKIASDQEIKRTRTD